MSNQFIQILGVSKSFKNGVDVLKNVSLDINHGEFVSILGPSGCGKTTLLRILMGLEQPTAGKIYKDGIDITDLEPSKRDFSIVFQDYALFSHMNVYQNVVYGLKIKGLNQKDMRDKANEIIEKVGLSEHVSKYPIELSGGQQQRVAIARALVMDSKVILLDEPFSALDAQVKVTLHEELKQLQKDFNITMIMVTHDQEEALSLSDKVIVMNEGNVEMIGSPFEIFNKATSEFIKTFVVAQINKRYKYVEELRK